MGLTPPPLNGATSASFPEPHTAPATQRPNGSAISERSETRAGPSVTDVFQQVTLPAFTSMYKLHYLAPSGDVYYQPDVCAKLTCIHEIPARRLTGSSYLKILQMTGTNSWKDWTPVRVPR